MSALLSLSCSSHIPTARRVCSGVINFHDNGECFIVNGVSMATLLIWYLLRWRFRQNTVWKVLEHVSCAQRMGYFSSPIDSCCRKCVQRKATQTDILPAITPKHTDLNAIQIIIHDKHIKYSRTKRNQRLTIQILPPTSKSKQSLHRITTTTSLNN